MLGALFADIHAPLLRIPGSVERTSAVWPYIADGAAAGGWGVAPPVTFSDYLQLHGSLGVVSKCIRINGQSVAQGILRFYGADDEDEEEPVTTGPTPELFESINPKLTSFDLIERTVHSLDYTGNAYWEFVRNAPKRGEKAWLFGVEATFALTEEDQRELGPSVLPAGEGASLGALLEAGPLRNEVIVRLSRGGYFRAPAGAVRSAVREIWPLNPGRMTVSPDRDGIAHYTYTVNGKPIMMLPEQIQHFMYPDPDNDFYGISPLRAFTRTIVGDELREKTNNALLKHGARPSAVMTLNKDTPDKTIEAEIIRWKATFAGADNAGKTVFIKGGEKFERMSFSPADLESASAARWNKYQLMQALDVPAMVYGMDPDDQSATKENSYVQVENYLAFGVIPRADRIERTVNESVLARLGLPDAERVKARFDFSRSPLIRRLLDDKAVKLSAIAQQNPGAVLTNELRSMLAGKQPRFGPVWYGTRVYGPWNMTQIADADKEEVETQPQPLLGAGQEQPQITDGTPQVEPKAGREVTVTQETALNGAQVTAATAIVQAVADGLMPRDAGIGQLIVFFNLTKEEAELVMGSVGAGFEQEVDAEPSKVSEASETSEVSKPVSSSQNKTVGGMLPDEVYFVGGTVVRAKPKASDIAAAAEYSEDDKEVLRMEKIFRGILESNGEAALAELDIAGSYDVDSPERRKWLKEKTIKFADAAFNEHSEEVREAVEEWVAAGENIQALATRINEVFDGRKGNSLTVARTELSDIANKGRVDAYEEAGIEEHEWVTQRDSNVRDAHADMDGEVVKIGERFSSGQRWPGDQDGVDPSLFVNERCDSMAVIPGAERSREFKDASWRAFDKRGRSEETLIEKQFIRMVDILRKRVLAKVNA